MINLILQKYPGSIDRLEIPVPEKWDELTGDQLGIIAHALYTERNLMVANTRIAHAFIGDIIKHIDLEIIIENLFPYIEWVRKDEDFIKQLLPCINFKDKKNTTTFYGPSDGLFNMVMIEFDFAERELYAWHQDKSNLTLLYRFVACLYRPGRDNYNLAVDPDGDCREQFNDNLIEQRAEYLVQHLPEHYAYGIMLWYKGCREFMMQQFPRVFKKSAPGEEEKREESDQQPSYFELMRMIAKTNVYGDFEKVERMYTYTALREMDCTIADQERMEELLQSNKPNEE